jgi:hypothetical protein
LVIVFLLRYNSTATMLPLSNFLLSDRQIEIMLLEHVIEQF